MAGVYTLSEARRVSTNPGRGRRESERGARDRGRWGEMRRRAESDKGEKEGEICRPVGLFDFTCSYVIEYYTRPPRWKG